MVIKLKPRKKQLQAPPPIIPDFTIKDVEWLFSQNKNWDKFYKENESKLWESNIDVYKWCVFPLHLKEDRFYRCVLHPQVEINLGPDKKPMLQFFRNIHYAEFISHCIYYRPDEHKQYIMEKLFGSHVNNSNNRTTDTRV